MGPLSLTWSFTNRLTSQVSPRAVFTTALEEQLAPLNAKAVHPWASQRPPATARRPRVATDLATAYKYPSPLSTL
jgi:hypothetical protein